MEQSITKSPFDSQAGARDSLFLTWEMRSKFEGIFEDAVRYITNKDLKRTELWKKFIQVFHTNQDTDDGGWRCEYWGKMMRGAAWIFEYNHDAELYEILEATVEEMLEAEDELGRISSYTIETEFTGWDMWGRKYILLGLQYFYEICVNKELKTRIRASMERQMDYVIAHIGEEEGKKDIRRASRSWYGANSCSFLEPTMRLYNLTQKKEYLDFAEYIVNTGFCTKKDLIELALEDEVAPYEYPQQKAYETMSCFEGLIEYYRVTGIETYKTAAVNFARKIMQTDVTVIGCCGCTHELFDHSALKQTGTDYKGIMQETCVSVTWMKLCLQMLRLTGDATFADCMEQTFFNAYLGSFNTYGNEVKSETRSQLSQIEEEKRPIPQILPFDSYSPLIAGTRGRKVGGYKVMEDKSFYGCCACIGAAGTGVIPKANILRSAEGFALNFYFPGKISVVTPQGQTMTIALHTKYPFDGKVEIRLDLEYEEAFDLALRIPSWSKETKLSCNGEEMDAQKGYTKINRIWNDKDTIELLLDMRVKAVLPPKGAMNEEHFVAFQYGPIMLAQDARLGTDLAAPVKPECDEEGYVFHAELCECNEIPDSEICFELTNSDGSKFRLINYCSAGKTWDEESKCAVWIPR